MSELTTKTLRATDLAIQTSGVDARAIEGAVDPNDPLAWLPDPWLRPAPAGGWAVDSPTTLVAVALHADARARVDYLVIDPDDAPLTGNYSLDLGASIATYDATSEAPADVAALLAGWAAEIIAVYGPAGSAAQLVAAADVVSYRIGGAADCIRLTAIDPEDGTRGTYPILANTIAPFDADLHVMRELEGATFEVLGRESVGSDTVTDSLGTTALRTGWRRVANGSPFAITEGWEDSLATGGLDRLHILLSTPLVGSDTVIDVLSGTDPRVTVVDMALVRVAPTPEP